jgi:hypothetical protein
MQKKHYRITSLDQNTVQSQNKNQNQNYIHDEIKRLNLKMLLTIQFRIFYLPASYKNTKMLKYIKLYFFHIFFYANVKVGHLWSLALLGRTYNDGG